MKKIKIFIDPTSRIYYASYYIKGLWEVYGKNNVQFSSSYFKDLDRKGESNAYDHYMAFIIVDDKHIKKVVIDFRDKQSVKEYAYDWCDVYAKINYSTVYTDKRFHNKMRSIPPGFGIKIWGTYGSIINCIGNLLECSFSPITTIKTHLGDYYHQFRRPKIDDYMNTNDNYEKKSIFLIATLWSHKNCLTTTNVYRRTFVETCKSLGIDFEGGFFATPSHPQYEEFKHLVFTKRYKVLEYVSKTKKSLFVFNTPAVHDCHGWKLGEYLAMGKAIISTPLTNNLPEDLIHGKNIHFINNSDELIEAIKYLTDNNDYRINLENESNQYYTSHASPKAVIENIIR